MEYKAYGLWHNGKIINSLINMSKIINGFYKIFTQYTKKLILNIYFFHFINSIFLS
jgi:hypothetical protein